MREKRQHQRAEYVVPVRVAVGEQSYEAESQDISLGGMFLVGEKQPTIGAEVTVIFELPRLGSVELPGFVRWVKTGGYGVQFGLIGPRETHAIGRLVRGPDAAPASVKG